MIPALRESPASRRVRASLPGEPGLPVVGIAPSMLRDPIGTAARLNAKHGAVCWTRSLGVLCVMAIGPEANQAIFRNTDQAFANSAWNYYIGPFFHRGLMLLDFDEHRAHRSVMQAAFKRPLMERYFENMQPTIARGVTQWPVGRTVRLGPRLKQLTLDVATEVFMGERLRREAERVNRAFIDAVRGGSALVRYSVPLGRWRRGLEGRALLERFFRARIAGKRANPGEDLFSRLCEATDDEGNRYTDDDIVNHMIFLMMAAHDTSTITLTSLLYHLAKYPTWQDLIRAELLGAGAGPVALNDFNQMPNLDRAMKEALRLVTPVPALARETVKDVELLGHTIPAGTYVIVCPQATHRLDGLWKRPAVFDPGRFAPGREEHRQHPFAFVPFGGGAHKCIGMHFGEMEIKAVVHHLLTRYRLHVEPDYEMPIDWTSLPVAKDGLRVRLERLR